MVKSRPTVCMTFTINQNEVKISHRTTAQKIYKAPNLNRSLKQNEISQFATAVTSQWLH